MLIDTHCHLEKEEYDDVNSLIDDIFQGEVGILVVSGYDVKSSKEALALAHKYNNIYATVGFHPHECTTISRDDLKLLDEWLEDEKVVGLGEIGLDYYYDLEQKEQQIDLFKKQVDIAIKHDKPIVVHNRDASTDVYDILSKTRARGVIHCFNDNLDIAKKFIELGFLLGVGGIITFKSNHNKSVIESVPLDYIVLETDSPYLTPEPYRGTKNSPLYLPLVANALAKLKAVEYNEVAAKTSSNARRIFDFKRDLW